MTKTAVLMVNLGTPRSNADRDVKEYLNEFLTDGRVIDIPWMKRQLLVRGIIVPRRYRASAKTYREIWTAEGSPLMVYSQQVAQGVQQLLGEEYSVALAMRYQTPSIENALENFKRQLPSRLIVLPLFPQYASATTGSVHQKVMELVSQWTTIPEVHLISQYAADPLYIDALCHRAAPFNLEQFDHILLSFHGLPEKQLRKASLNNHCLQNSSCCAVWGDQNRLCYRAQCMATARALTEKLQLQTERYTICFQSRLGKGRWIHPYTSDVVAELARSGKKRVLVFSPSFVCDCLETLYEIERELNAEFQHLGGGSLTLVPGLNADPYWIGNLAEMIRRRTPATV